ncbi:MAG: exonuclease subunit SbcD [Saprospiraceae bacterium]
MKIVHTADWHIGKILHRHDLTEDISLFFDWLIQFLLEEKADLLLVSGDVFDLANPANKDVALYYKTLLRLSALRIKVIITGGNHDSISLLEAPAGLLNTLDIHVIGGAKEDISEEIIPCYNPDGSLGCVVLAVPFLRDKDLRASLPADQAYDKTKMTEAGVRYHYEKLVNHCISTYGDEVAIIAMGHLMMKGAVTSDSEREIHVGNLDGLVADIVPDSIDYMALGHIHKPQKVQNHAHIRYSGSPIFLDFSERNYEKKVIVLNVKGKKDIQIVSSKIPVSRDMLRFSGDLESVKTQLNNFKNEKQLCAFIELDVVEDSFNILKVQELEEWREKTNSDTYKILKSRISFSTDGSNTSTNSFIAINKSINELSPLDIFRQKLDESKINTEISTSLTEAYMVLLEELNH